MPESIPACVPLVFDGTLTIRTVETVHAMLRAAIRPSSGGASKASIAIDCSPATEIDLAFIQLLIAARQSARSHGALVSLAAYPDGVLLDSLTRGGFRIVPEDGAPGFWFVGDAA